MSNYNQQHYIIVEDSAVSNDHFSCKCDKHTIDKACVADRLIENNIRGIITLGMLEL